MSVELGELGRSLMDHPLAQRMTLRSRASGDNTVHSADDVLGERFQRLGALALAEAHFPGLVLMKVPPDRREDAIRTIIQAGMAAVPYLWTEAVREAVRGQGSELPRHTISPRLLPEKAIWSTFETGINIGGEGHVNDETFTDFVIDAMLLCDRGGLLEVIQFGEARDKDGSPRPMIDGTSFRYGSVYPDDFTDDADEGRRIYLQGVLMMLAFLNSPFIPRDRLRASRAARRDASRAGRPIEDEVTFILLRRAENRRSPESASEQSTEWKHQWLVSGHYRAHWYPKEQAHHVIWIAPHMKGPSDAPLITHAYKVVR